MSLRVNINKNVKNVKMVTQKLENISLGVFQITTQFFKVSQKVTWTDLFISFQL